MPLFIDTLRANPNAAIQIDSGGGPFIKGFIMQDFNFGGRNTFNSALEAIMGASNGIARANAALSGGTAAANYAGSDVASRIITAGDSVSSWVASDRPAFTLPLLFLAINDGDDPRAIMRDLMAFVYPTGNPFGVLTAPLGYVGSFYSTGAGCVAVRIGRWFQTPRLFVVKSVDMTVSQRTDPGGVPLYVGAVMSFEAQRTLTVDEVQAFFIG